MTNPMVSSHTLIISHGSQNATDHALRAVHPGFNPHALSQDPPFRPGFLPDASQNRH